jgi:hypothetical protein
MRLLVALVLGLCAPAIGLAATIGPTIDWIDIGDAARAYDLDPAGLAEIVDAGAQMYCESDAGGGVSNAWAVSARGEDFFLSTNHGFLGKDEHRTLLDTCKLTPFADLEGGVASPPTVGVAPETVLIPTANAGIANADDRARFDVAKTWRGTRLEIKLGHVNSVKVGTEIFIVSEPVRGQKRAAELPYAVQIQRCTVRAISDPLRSSPRLLSDCDTYPGNSGGLVFIRDFADPHRLFPIGMHVAGSLEDGKTWNASASTGISLLMNAKFLDFERRTIAAETLTQGTWAALDAGSGGFDAAAIANIRASAALLDCDGEVRLAWFVNGFKFAGPLLSDDAMRGKSTCSASAPFADDAATGLAVTNAKFSPNHLPRYRGSVYDRAEMRIPDWTGTASLSITKGQERAIDNNEELVLIAARLVPGSKPARYELDIQPCRQVEHSRVVAGQPNWLSTTCDAEGHLPGGMFFVPKDGELVPVALAVEQRGQAKGILGGGGVVFDGYFFDFRF